MSTIVLPMASSPLKRTATDAELDCAPLNPESNNTRDRHTLDEGDRETLSHAHTTQEPVAQGTNETSDIDPSNIHPMPHSTIASPDVSQADAAASSNNPAKRRKLTFAEKEAQKIEKAHKELRKKEELARKEEEKAKKEEEKVRKEQEKKAREEEKRAKEELKENERKKREEEKEEKRKVKEAEKVAKDEEKKRKDAEKKVKEDEKSKKERVRLLPLFLSFADSVLLQAQLRLNSFFTNPKPFPQGPDSPLRGENLTPTRRNSVASSRGGSKASSRASSICPEPRKSDWERCYPPFFLHAYTTLAPNNRFRKAKKPQLGKISAIEQLDCLVNGEDSAKATTHTKPLLPMPTRSKPRLVPLPPTRDIIDRINGTLIHPIDLTKPSSDPSPLQLLGALPVKYLKYYEDVRPPYIGTFTRRPTSSRSLSKICRRPCASRDLPGTNYDYDSEAEWEEPDEGEDLDSEGELDEEGDDDADDLDGFLDDEGAEQARKRIFGGDMIPVQTGLCWDDGKKGSKEVDFGESKLDLKTLGIRGLLGRLKNRRRSLMLIQTSGSGISH